MKTLLRLLLKSQHQGNRSGPAHTENGMTLVELLVGSIMAFLIITPMLGFVVDMLNTDRREQVKSNTEQDLQAAVDFIAQDLSQAIYIYDGKTLNQIRDQLPKYGDKTRAPILVFWKRQLIKKSIPVDASIVKPKDCNLKSNPCNDTYLRSLVAYYQFKDTDNTWCQPSGNNCPTRIARYEITDGVKNPLTQAYYDDSETTKGQRKNKAFKEDFDISKPTLNVTTKADFPDPQVLVNYIDHSTANLPPLPNCKSVLGVVDPIQAGSTPIDPADLLITDSLTNNPTNSFYACVDTSKNLARVTIRGNSLRRLQPNDTEYNPNKSAFFPTASVQVQGLGGLGK